MTKSLKRRSVDIEKVYRILTYAFLVLLVIWRVPFLNKGIDYTDTGYNMTKYRDFFVEVSSNSIGRFFTQLIGALIYNALPAYHLLVFRIMHLVMWSAAFLIIYFTFRRPTPCYYNVVLSLLLLLTSSYQKMGEALYSYYPFSMLMVAVATYLMYTALVKDKPLRLLASGIVLGVNFGVRLPNVLFFSLVIVVLWYYICKKQTKTGFARSGIMLGGIAIGFGVMAVLEVIVLGIGSAGDSLSSYVDLAGSSSKDHGIINQILHIFQQIQVSVFHIGYYVFPIVLACCVFMLLYRVVFKMQMHKLHFKVLMYSAVVLAAALWFVFIVINKITIFKFIHDFGLIALIFASVSVFALKKQHPELSAAALISIISAGCIIIGTDLGISRFADVLPQLCVALAIGATYIVPKAPVKKIKYYICLYFNRICKITVAVMLGLTAMMSSIMLVPLTYNDASFEKLTTPLSDDIVTMRGMKTTAERAESFNNLYFAMQEDELAEKPIAVIGMFPLVYNLVDNDKYFRQTCIDYNSVSIESLREQHETNKNNGVYPVIVFSRLHMNQNNLEALCEDEEKLDLFNEMLTDCDYTIVFFDENFDVYAPVE